MRALDDRRKLLRLSSSLIRTISIVAVLAAPLAAQDPAATSDVPRRVASSPWDASTLGNPRVVVTVPSGTADVVRVDVPWRRRDADPESKHLIVTDADGLPITNVLRQSITRERGEVCRTALQFFEPAENHSSALGSPVSCHSNRRLGSSKVR